MTTKSKRSVSFHSRVDAHTGQRDGQTDTLTHTQRQRDRWREYNSLVGLQRLIFYRATLCYAVYAVTACLYVRLSYLSIRPSVRLSQIPQLTYVAVYAILSLDVLIRHCIKMAKRRITQRI